MTDKMQKLSVRLDGDAARPMTSTTTARTSSSSTGFNDTVVIVGGFPQETPRGALEAVWTNDLQNLKANQLDISGIHVEASYLLSSSLQARCVSASQARSLVNLTRRLAPNITFNNAHIQIYATIQKPKEFREKNGVLLRTAEYLQTNLFGGLGRVENYK